MARSLFVFASSVLSVLTIAPATFAQSHQINSLNSCIREFYDPGMYNYLSYRNNCSQSLTIVFIAKDGSSAGGTMNLRPGASDSVGRLAGGVVPKIGDFQLYVCQAGYMPVDEENKVVTKPHTIFRCQSKAQ